MHLESRNLGGRARLLAAALLSLFIIGSVTGTSATGTSATAETASTQPAKSAKPTFDKNSPFYFDGTISRQTLENYLDHAITMGYFLVPGQPERYQFPYRDDDVRMIRNMGAKFIGRALYRWSEEAKLGDPAFLEYAKKMADTVHAADPEVIFQGCLFENVSADVNKLKIPAWVFEDFGQPVEDRTFSRAEIIKRTGKGGGRGGVPIINNLETRLWFYYLAASYINVGCEALHLGQVGLIGADDKDLKVYSAFLAKVRTYAKLHARRHLVLMDGHVPSGGMIKDGVSLLDFNSFPMRIKAVPGKWVPGKPQEAILEVGHLDAIFKRSKGCVSPSGWKCDSLPYLVEFDNFGRGPNPNVADPKSMFCWGWDEISWFAQQPEEYRNQWLLYAHNWIKQTDPNGHLEMPGTRMITCPNETLRTYFANTKSKTCPVGYSQEETIKKIWSAPQERAVEVTNTAGKSTLIDDKMLKTLPRHKVEIKDAAEKTATYEGVVLAALLEKAGIKLEKELRGARLANYLLIEAKDGYRVIFALPEVDPTVTDNLILFADTKDGKALDDKEGPYRIIVPHEKHHVRWVRQVTRISEQSAPPALEKKRG
jgi:hypothetical protein